MRRTLVALLLVLAAVPARAATPYSRANSTKTPVKTRCAAVCYSAANLLQNPPQTFRMSQTSKDGRYAVFFGTPLNDATAALQVYVYDRKTGVVDLASRGPDGKPGQVPNGTSLVTGAANYIGVDVSSGIGITADGRYAWFTTYAALLPNDRNKSLDVYAYDRVLKRVVRLSTDIGGAEIGNGRSGVMSADGSTVTFISSGDVLRKGVTHTLLYWKNLRTHKAGVVVDDTGKPDSANGNAPTYALSANGRYLLDSDDWAHTTAIGFTTTFGVYDLWTNRYQTVPGSDRGLPGQVGIDAAARAVVFNSRDGIMRVDLATGAIQTVADLAPTLVRPTFPTLSDDGRTMTVAAAGALGADPTQNTGGVYAIPIGADGKAGTPKLVTPLPAAGTCTQVDCARHQFVAPVVSGNGHAVTFLTDQALVPEDPVVDWDVYVASF